MVPESLEIPEGWVISDDVDNAESNATPPEQQYEIPEGWTVSDEYAPEGYVSPPPPEFPKKTKENESFGEFAERIEGMKTETPKINELSYADRLKWEEQVAKAEQEGQTEALKSILSGMSFGYSENIPGMRTQKGAAQEVGKLVGSVGPLHVLTKVLSPVGQAVGALSPILKKQVGGLLTAFGVGAADKALHQMAEGKVPSGVDAANEGLLFAAVDMLVNAGGKTIKFGKKLYDYMHGKYNAGELTADTARKVYEFVKPKGALKNQYKELVESIEQRTPTREIKVTKVEPGQEIAAAEKLAKPSNKAEIKAASEAIEKLKSEKVQLAEVSEPGPKDFSKQVDALEKGTAEETLSRVGEKKTVEQLGDDVKRTVEKRFAEEKAVYSDLYNEVKDLAHRKNLRMIPTQAGNAALQLFIDFMALQTNTPEQRAVLKQLETIFNDLRMSLLDGNQPVSVASMIDLASTINQTIPRTELNKTAKHALLQVSTAIKNDVKSFLKEFDKNLYAGYTMAEEEVARVANIYNTPAMRQLRAAKTPEAVVSMIERNPSVFGYVKKAVTPEVFGAVERKLIEKMEQATYKKAKEMLKDFSPHMTDNGKRVAEDIVKMKNPFNPHVMMLKPRKAILNEMGNSLLTGKRPKYTMDLWKGKKGRQLVKDAFRGDKSWGEIKRYLQEQHFHDVIKEITTKEGTFNFEKLTEMMKNPTFRQDIRDLGGEQAVKFFEGMEKKVEQMTANLQILEQTPTLTQAERVSQEAANKLGRAKGHKVTQPAEHIRIGEESSKVQGRRILEGMAQKDFPIMASKMKWIEWAKEILGLDFKTATSVFGVWKLAGGHKIGSAGSAGLLLANNWLDKLLTSPAARQAFNEAAKQTHDPLKVIMALHGLKTTMEE